MDEISGLTILLLLHLVIATAVCTHILLTKTEAAAPAWIALVVVSPFVGALMYWILGINRVQRRARRLRGRKARYVPQLKDLDLPFLDLPTHQQRQIFQFESAVHDAPFLGGNTVVPLIGADEVFPDMMRSIASAKTCIALSVYIFDCDDIGEKVAETLKDAYARGVAVYVLVDEIGSGNKARAADVKLAAAGIPTARFIPQRLKFLPIVNLRNHRKIMIIDGNVGYIGGMNICRNYNPRSTETVRDVHFRVAGPVLEQMSAIFEEDWRFATGNNLQLPAVLFDQEQVRHPQYARVVPDGPDNHFQRTLWILLGALALAQRSIHIVTPYFLPNEVLMHALSICCLRGVVVGGVQQLGSALSPPKLRGQPGML